MISLTEDKRMLGYEALAPYSNISCFVTTRHGGCSRGDYASFNCTPYTGDDAECVRRNQELLCASLLQRPKELIIPFQTHGTEALAIDDTYLQATDAERHALLQGIDALMTREPGCCICISTADCIPILLYDKEHQAIAAVHAGWRGTVNYILGHTLERMRTLYATEGKDIIACIGPGISLPSFEVGDEVYDTFREQGFPMEYISEWKPQTHKHHIDLWAANRLQLLDFGVPGKQIESAGICTYRQHEDFFSARRLGIKSGRILSGIMITHN
ncbi:MAG: peptidoglycan editing factor PgeF [Bacteroides sp.]|nr:peptidoglycan editing factor PgeF [Bacteroides sp.]